MISHLIAGPQHEEDMIRFHCRHGLHGLFGAGHSKGEVSRSFLDFNVPSAA